jgi:hypothetical protein
VTSGEVATEQNKDWDDMSNSFYLGMQVWCIDVPAAVVLRGVISEVHISTLAAHFLVIQTKDGRRLTCTTSLVFSDDVAAHETLDYMQALSESALEYLVTTNANDIQQTRGINIRKELAECYGFSA